jgi:hypothetical protein
MFVDQPSLDAILQEEEIKPSVNGSLGLWRIVLIKNLPYLDGRRNGKVPKFLTHRLFPNARLVYNSNQKNTTSWLDSNVLSEIKFCWRVVGLQFFISWGCAAACTLDLGVNEADRFWSGRLVN